MIAGKAEKIKIVIVDVDGVLTDGLVVYGNFSDEYRAFNVRDGLGFILLHKAGLKSAIITSKSSRAISRRAKELKIKILLKNSLNKLTALRKILKKFKLKPEEACFFGDDLLDLAALKVVGLSVTVPDACDEIKKTVDYVTKNHGGKGAVREIIEIILKSQGKWDELIRHYAG